MKDFSLHKIYSLLPITYSLSCYNICRVTEELKWQLKKF